MQMCPYDIANLHIYTKEFFVCEKKVSASLFFQLPLAY